MAQLLVKACENVARKAGFRDVYIQAATQQRDRSNPLGDWIRTSYDTAVKAYQRAGYKSWQPHGKLLSWDAVDRTATLMHKRV